MAEPQLIAVGFYCGPFFGDCDERPDYWEVRVGEESVQLTNFDALNMWHLCRGVRRAADAAPSHDRPAILEIARGLGIESAEHMLHRLIEEGVVVAVGPEATPALEFAEAHCVQPLLVGFGNAPEALDRYLLGATPDHIYAQLTAAEYDAWAITPTARSIRHAVDETVGRIDDVAADAELATLLPTLFGLVAQGAMYVDVTVGTTATRPADRPRAATHNEPSALPPPMPPPPVPPAEEDGDADFD